MSRKDKTPVALKMIRWGFPKLERIMPALAHRYFVKLFFTPFRYTMPEKEREFFASAHKKTFVANGKRIQGYIWGEGPVVWVMHGWAGRATQFRKFITALNAAGFQVAGIDGPAHGKSDGKSTNILEFEEVFKEWMNYTGKPVAVIAHSFGGVAMLFAISRGLPINRLINIASPTIANEIVNTYLRAIGGSPSTGEAFKKFMVKTYGKTFEEFSALHFVKQLPAPIDLLLVHDDGDEEVTIQHPLELLKVYPQAKLIRTTGLGHNRILKEDPVINEVIDFIKKA